MLIKRHTNHYEHISTGEKPIKELRDILRLSDMWYLCILQVNRYLKHRITQAQSTCVPMMIKCIDILYKNVVTIMPFTNINVLKLGTKHQF